MTETATVEQPQTEQPLVQTSDATPTAPETQSLRQHAKDFGHDKASSREMDRGGNTDEAAKPTSAGAERARDDAGRFAKADERPSEAPKPDEPKRHARKDIATPEDVPRIRELTAKYRNEERLRLAAEARLAQYEAQTAQAPAFQAPAGPVPLQHAIAQPDTSRPALTDAEFYTAYPDATIADFMDYRYAYRDALKEAQHTQQTNQSEIDAFTEKTETDHRSRIEAYAAKVPDWDQIIESAKDVPTTPVVDWAVKLHPRGPEVVLHLARHPEDAFSLALQTRQAPLDEASVAWTQRLFDRWLTPASTASGRPARHPIAPPPPNAVRTGPIKTGDEPPADGAGIRAHAKYFGYEKRR